MLQRKKLIIFLSNSETVFSRCVFNIESELGNCNLSILLILVVVYQVSSFYKILKTGVSSYEKMVNVSCVFRTSSCFSRL